METTKKQKNIKLLKMTGVALIDGIVSTRPELAISWGLVKGLYQTTIELRRDRAIEFIEIIMDNPNIFTKDILNSEEFQDGFAYTFKKYLTERTEIKRKMIKDVFFGFTKSNNKNNFRLERMLSTVEQISIEEIEVLKIFFDNTIKEWYRKQFPMNNDMDITKKVGEPLNVVQIGEHILSKMKGLKKFNDLTYTLEILLRLSNLGLLIGVTDVTWDSAGSTFKKSEFGKEFMFYILK